jgi:putative nucleotidyltransferase with HDIG domain
MNVLGASPGPALAADSTGSHISLSQVFSALSFALDLVEDARPGHSVRCCLFGLRIARYLSLPIAQQNDLYYALLLKDAGCSSNAQLVCEWVGADDRALKRDAKLLDWTRKSIASIRLLWRSQPPGSTVRQRLRRMMRMAAHPEGFSVMLIRARCERGAAIALKMGINPTIAQAVRSLDEHWDGGGAPDKLRGEQIPLFSRIMQIAQHLDIFASEFGPRTAVAMLHDRSGTWFDPQLVAAVADMDRISQQQQLRREDTDHLWQGFGSGRELEIVLQNEPGLALLANEDRIDRIAEAFADIVDAKSSFTYRHSIGVTQLTVAIARQMGLPPERVRTLYRAALLHDLGKLRVPNTILDKQGALTPQEWATICEHPGLSERILERIDVFAEIARIAGGHHEKLDGSGYPRGLKADQIPLETRIVTVADMYTAMTEERPYRGQRSMEETVSILRQLVPNQLDPDCFAALLQYLAYPS